MDLRDYFNWNIQCLAYATLFEIGVMVQYPVWQVILTVCLICFPPKLANVAWLLVRYRAKRRAVLSNVAANVFYLVHTILFVLFVSCATYFLASIFTYDYVFSKDWIVNVAYLWAGIYLTTTGALSALYTYSWIILIFKYRKHLQNTKYDETTD